jgi:hypothetical protein
MTYGQVDSGERSVGCAHGSWHHGGLKRPRSARTLIVREIQLLESNKCKENVRTWFIGRVKEPRAIEKLKPMPAVAKGNVADKLTGQATGEFYLVREDNVTSVRSDESFMRTEQLPENKIAELARRLWV